MKCFYLQSITASYPCDAAHCELFQLAHRMDVPNHTSKVQRTHKPPKATLSWNGMCYAFFPDKSIFYNFFRDSFPSPSPFGVQTHLSFPFLGQQYVPISGFTATVCRSNRCSCYLRLTTVWAPGGHQRLYIHQKVAGLHWIYNDLTMSGCLQLLNEHCSHSSRSTAEICW